MSDEQYYVQEAADAPHDTACAVCNGTGEGMHDGSRCWACGGSGLARFGLGSDDYNELEFDRCGG